MQFRQVMYLPVDHLDVAPFELDRLYGTVPDAVQAVAAPSGFDPDIIATS
jgi:hypothetical protein